MRFSVSQVTRTFVQSLSGIWSSVPEPFVQCEQKRKSNLTQTLIFEIPILAADNVAVVHARSRAVWTKAGRLPLHESAAARRQRRAAFFAASPNHGRVVAQRNRRRALCVASAARRIRRVDFRTQRR